MRDEATERDEHREDPNAAMTILVGIVSSILLFAIIVALQALFYEVQDSEVERKMLRQGPAELRILRSDQLEQINTYRWVDQANGVVAIPVDRAMDLMVREAREGEAP